MTVPSPKVQIVIVNWNAGAWLGQCLESVAAHGGAVVERIVVVDNGSTDGSADLPARPGLEVIRTGENLGFAKACNLGAKGATAEYLLFLNPDAAIGPETLATAIGFMESDAAKKVAVCGIRLIDEHGEVQRQVTDFPKPSSIFTLRTMLADFDHLHSRLVEHVAGAFYLMRRRVFEQLNGFDESFFVYLEDLDLSLRTHQLGWSVYYLAEASSFHKGGGTSEQVKARRLFYALRSRLIYAFKHFRRHQAWMVTATTLFVEPLARLGRGILRRSGRELGETMRAYGLLWRDLPNIRRIVSRLRNGGAAAPAELESAR
jgi:GT2 family glycosyltransferase